MLTLFTIPKPFRNHTAIIQRNAIQSWLQLRPVCEIILLGNDDGTADLAKEFGLRHIPQVACNEYGTPLLNSAFELAQSEASYPLLAYVNTDIILLNDFLVAIQRISLNRFLMVGQRWDLDLNYLWDFSHPTWETRLRTYVIECGTLHAVSGIDYFVFPAGFWSTIPPFAIGRSAWDNWLIYQAWVSGAAVIDATQVVTAIHQNHDYTHVAGGFDGVWKGMEAQCNLELAGGWSHIFTLQEATHSLTQHGLKWRLNRQQLLRYLKAWPVFSSQLRWPVYLLSKSIRLLRSVRRRLGLISNLGGSQ